MRAVRFILCLALICTPVAAEAVTVRDIIELTKAGLSDDILVAVIEADRTIFTLDKDQILELRTAGVSETVILKMLRSRREFDAEAGGVESAASNERWFDAPPQPGLVIIGAQPAPPPVIVVPQYYYVPLSIWGLPLGSQPNPQPVLAPEYRGFGRFINDGWVERR